jgi:hypothetical protein
MVIATLLQEWKTRANQLRRWAGASEAAVAWETAAAELEAALSNVDDRVLDLQRASAVSGYSSDHLGRLLRQGRIPNAGRLNSPKIRVSDLPRKPGYSPPAEGPSTANRQRGQIARTLVLLHRERADG